MTPSGRTPVYAVLGHPIAHSRSPALHNAWFRACNVDGIYVALPLPGDRSDALATLLRSGVLAGANLTVPLKTDAVPLMDRLTPEAVAAGAVNTVRVEADGLTGHNTDGRGFVQALTSQLGPIPPRPAAVLGTGGAGRAVAAGLAQHGLTDIHLFNRTLARAEETARHLRTHFPHCRFHSHPLTAEAFAPVSSQLGVVAQCTSGPGRSAVAAVPIDHLPDDCQWCDLNYWDASPPHGAALRSRFIDGHGMLVHQAALAFAFWTGVTPEVDLGG